MKYKLISLLSTLTLAFAIPATPAVAMFDPGVEGQGNECLNGCQALQTCVWMYLQFGDEEWLVCIE